ncbi:MAG: hypothetical protein M3Z41_00275 [Candidatus Eremiobacteraeota bacterium]|nr:hypothetical protein [Candidatus Eremiobacteraeota bacterium]
MRTILHVSFAVLIVFGASSSIASSNTAKSSTLTGKMTSARYLIGTWSCATKVAAFGKTAAHTETAKSLYWIESGNTVGSYYGAKGYSSSGYQGWMASKNLWWSSWSDRFGGIGAGTGKDSGTNAQLLTGTRWFQGQPSPVRDTMTKNTDTSFRDLVEVKTNGTWSWVADSACTKISNKMIYD